MASSDDFTKNAEDILADAADAVKPDPAPKGEGDGGEKLKAALLISTAVAAVLGAIFAIAKKINVKEAPAA